MHTLNLFLFHLINNAAGHYCALDVLMIGITTYVPYASLAVAMAIFFVASVRDNALWSRMILVGREAELGLSVFVAWFLAKILKVIVALPRPFSTLPNVHQLIAESDYSFPSNHAVVSFTVATVVYFYHKKLGIALYAIAALVALSRVYVGVHYPIDVIAGALFGIAIPHLIHGGFSHIGKYTVQ